MKSGQEIMEILEAFDLTGSSRAAAALCGTSHHTVARYVALREAGLAPDARDRRDRLVDPFLDKIEEWVERSRAKIRADVAHDRLRALGYVGSERTTRRALAEAKQTWRRGTRRVYRPWVPEPGMWAQWDWGSGPRIGARDTSLFCAWLAWCRFRVVIPTWDRTLPTLTGCLDMAMRRFGGAPTYWLTDNGRTVTTGHVAGLALRNPELVAAARHYGITIATCVPADPESKGGSEATVRIAKADLVPTDANLLPDYADFVALEAACAAFCAEVNARPHPVTRRPPAEMLAEEHSRLHRLPEAPFTATFGTTRKVSWSATISFGGVLYSVPHTLADEIVWARVHGDELVVVHVGDAGSAEVARHRLSAPGNPRIDDAHYPPRPPGALRRQPRAVNPTEAEFLAIGVGARLWLTEAAAAGTARVKVKMAEAVAFAALHGVEVIDWALGHAATAGRFGEGDLAAIVAHHAGSDAHRAGEDHSLQGGTRPWEGFGK